MEGERSDQRGAREQEHASVGEERAHAHGYPLEAKQCGRKREEAKVGPHIYQAVISGQLASKYDTVVSLIEGSEISLAAIHLEITSEAALDTL